MVNSGIKNTFLNHTPHECGFFVIFTTGLVSYSLGERAVLIDCLFFVYLPKKTMEEKIKQSIRTFLTYDLTSRKEYLNPHCKETSKRLDNDANKLTELVLKEFKK